MICFCSVIIIVFLEMDVDLFEFCVIRLTEKVNDRWEVCVSLSEGQFQQVCIWLAVIIFCCYEE